MSQTVFPKDFLWGAATAAPQIEGGYREDGRTPSIWDEIPKGKVKKDENCHEACDHYHRYKEDVAIMKELGLKSYRFSISWSRIIPKEGVVNPKGIEFYNHLIDELLAEGIEPLITIYHWDLPMWAHRQGGWKDKKIIECFAEYTKVLVEAFSDRVKYWITFNEPQCFLMNGYMQGVHAPFVQEYLSLPKITTNFMLANAAAVKVIREKAKQKPSIGLSFAAGAFLPKDEHDEASIEEARKKSFYKGIGVMNNRWWMDPILLGKSVTAYGVYRLRKKDLEKIQVKLDFLAINNYEAFDYAAWGGDKSIDKSKLPKTLLGWVIDGRSIYWTLRFLYDRYQLPIMITENGMANDDQVINGVVDDKVRADFIDEYIGYVKKAMKDGVHVIGYHHWSLLDNFEWAEGYDPRFGLVHVDYTTQKRTIKNSAYHYKEIIETNGEML